MAAIWGGPSSTDPLPVKTVTEVVVEEVEKWFEGLDEEDDD